MKNPPNQSDSIQTQHPKEIHTYDEYIAADLPSTKDKATSQSMTPQQFGASIAKLALEHIKEVLTIEEGPGPA